MEVVSVALCPVGTVIVTDRFFSEVLEPVFNHFVVCKFTSGIIEQGALAFNDFQCCLNTNRTPVNPTYDVDVTGI